MYGVINGAIPLKHARVATQAGDLAIRSVVTAEEYHIRRGFALPGLPASGEATNDSQGGSRVP